jgi:FMN phosphatase YigB (HAD superfamily)
VAKPTIHEPSNPVEILVRFYPPGWKPGSTAGKMPAATTMNSAPVLIFDLGKVLVNFDSSIAARKIAARSTMTITDMHAFLGASPHIFQYESGQLTRQQFYDSLCPQIGFQGDLAEFGSYFADIFSEMPGTIALHAELRKRGHKTYIFSNTNDLAIEHVQRNFPFFAHFDGYIYSYEVGAMKPDTAIYEAMEKMTGKRGADLIYIDDRPENIATGAARGWRAILHESPEKTRGALGKFGLI